MPTVSSTTGTTTKTWTTKKMTRTTTRKTTNDEDEDDEDDEISDPIAIALISELERLPPAEIASFERIFEEQRARADRPDLANAALLIEHGFLGDDSFDDFRAGLVSLGRESFEGALAAPDSLATHPIVREIAQANDPRWVGREDLLYAAGHAYAAVTGEDEVTFYDFVEEQFPADDVEPDDVEDWEITDETATRGRLPRLADMFYERSMRNRATGDREARPRRRRITQRRVTRAEYPSRATRRRVTRRPVTRRRVTQREGGSAPGQGARRPRRCSMGR